jgi:hypothetical protein
MLSKLILFLGFDFLFLQQVLKEDLYDFIVIINKKTLSVKNLGF